MGRPRKIPIPTNFDNDRWKLLVVSRQVPRGILTNCVDQVLGKRVDRVGR